MKWNLKDKRFIAFFDILGFKEMVLKKSHDDILKILQNFKKFNDVLAEPLNHKLFSSKGNYKVLQPFTTRSVNFSDSIIVFSKSDAIVDFHKMLFDIQLIMMSSLKMNIPIKGCISFGEISVDFENNLFFGQPIIDAYTLHDELHMIGVLADHNCEKKIKEFLPNDIIENMCHFRKTKMKFGAANQTIITSSITEHLKDNIDKLNKLYDDTSGRSRIYIDNSIDFYSQLLEETKN